MGKFNGMRVQDAKNAVKQHLIETGQGAIYYEPEGLVVSRSGEECIVALCDQWYLKYSDEAWKNKVHQHLNT